MDLFNDLPAPKNSGRAPVAAREKSQLPSEPKAETKKRPAVPGPSQASLAKKRARPDVTPRDALAKITLALAKPLKYSKAIRLLLRLFQSSFDVTCCGAFLAAFAAAARPRVAEQEPPPNEGESEDRKVLLELFSALWSQREHFPSRSLYALETWRLRFVDHARLFTDDTYQFCRAMKRITEALLGALQHQKAPAARGGAATLCATASGAPRAPGVDEEACLLRKAVLVGAVGTAYQFYKYRWAKTPVDSAFKVLTEHRGALPKHLRTDVDRWNATLIARRAGGPKAASVSCFDSHPLRNVSAVQRACKLSEALAEARDCKK